MQVKTDPQFRFAVEQLQKEIPKLYQEYNKRNRYVGASKGGPPIRMTLGTGGKYRMHWTNLDDGSALHDTAEMRKSLKRELEKSGKGPAEVDSILERFDSAPNDVEFEVTPGLSFIKRDVTTIYPDLRGELISDRLIAKIGYVHLCLCVTPELLMTHRAFFEPIVEFVRGGEKPEYIEIKRGLREKYQPSHMFRVDCEEGKTTLKFQIFGVIAFDFVLSGLTIRDVEFPVIIHNLSDQRVWASRNWCEFLEGKYCPIDP